MQGGNAEVNADRTGQTHSKRTLEQMEGSADSKRQHKGDAESAEDETSERRPSEQQRPPPPIGTTATQQDSGVIVHSNLGSIMPGGAITYELDVLLPGLLPPALLAEKQALYKSMFGSESGPAPADESSRLARFNAKYERPTAIVCEAGENIHQGRCEVITQECHPFIYGSSTSKNGEVVAMTGASGYKRRAPHLMIHRRRTEQDEAAEGDGEEEGVQYGSARPEKEEEGGETYGRGAGDKLFFDSSRNPGFWEPGSASCVDDERGLVWASGDSRIKAFPSNDLDLPCKHTLQAGGEVLGLAINKDRLYASVGKTIKYWRLGEIEEHKEDVSSGELTGYSGGGMTEEERKECEAKYENRLDSSMLDESDLYDVEVTRGQPAHGSFDTPVPFKSLLALPASVAGSPSALAATRNRGTTLHVYDLEREKISATFSGHKKQIVQISAAAGLPNLIAGASWDASARVWDVRTGGAVCTLKDRCDESLWGVALVATEGGYPFCFTGGRNESVLAWDLRMLRSLYELSTGNNHVSALYWTEPSQSLLAITSCPHVDDRGMGEYYEDVINPDDHREPYRWPRPARHGVKDFPARWDAGNHLFIRYAFVRCPSQKVPQANQPYPNEPYDRRSWF